MASTEADKLEEFYSLFDLFNLIKKPVLLKIVYH